MPQPPVLYDTLLTLLGKPRDGGGASGKRLVRWTTRSPCAAGRAGFAQSTVRRFSRWLSNPRGSTRCGCGRRWAASPAGGFASRLTRRCCGAPFCVPALVGALAGSFALTGEYMRSGYPNWATKYFLDALLLQHEAESRKGQ